jgi:hypothetical protein
MFWSLWSAGIAGPHVILWLVCVWRWGWVDGSLFSSYSLAMASLYLGAGLWFAGGLPFVKPPNPGRAPQSQSIMMGLLVFAALLMVAQNFIVFRSGGLTLLSIPVAATAAAAMTWASLRVLAVNVRMSLDQLTTSPSRMFAATTRDDG